MSTPWRRCKVPRALFANSQLLSMHASLENVHVLGNLTPNLQLNVDLIFLPGAKRLPRNLLKNILADFLCEHGDHVVLATDGSMVEDKAGIGIS